MDDPLVLVELHKAFIVASIVQEHCLGRLMPMRWVAPLSTDVFPAAGKKDCQVCSVGAVIVAVVHAHVNACACRQIVDCNYDARDLLKAIHAACYHNDPFQISIPLTLLMQGHPWHALNVVFEGWHPEFRQPRMERTLQFVNDHFAEWTALSVPQSDVISPLPSGVRLKEQNDE